ncbi:universal stress protein [Natronorarus salvus]|uniref:universal stress protein n=1 Tax=Natronorarus salvus TaxID=3117733 RepID=UPI002F26C1D9
MREPNDDGGTMNGERPEVLVAVGNPDHVEQLTRTAGDIARVREAGIRIVTVVVKSSTSPVSMFTDETIVQEYSGDRRKFLERAKATAPNDIPVEGEIVVARSAARGILQAIDEAEAEALVIGWQERTSRRDAILGTTVDAIIERSPCDVYVEHVGRVARSVETVLLPVAGGPHVRPAASVAKAIAAANDATVVVVSVASPDDAEEASESIAAASDALVEASGPSVDIETELVESGDVEDALVDLAQSHDVIVFGTTRHGALRRRLVGSIPRRVTERTDRTVILARAAEGAVRRRLTSLFGQVRR